MDAVAARLSVGGRPRTVARIVWTRLRGPIPSSTRLVRTCVLSPCVNPDHHVLRPVQGRRAGNRDHRRRRSIALLTAQELRDLIAYSAILRCDPCSYCGKRAATVDHIDALVAGGTVGADNVTASCATCNNEKFTRPLLLWLRDSRGGGAQVMTVYDEGDVIAVPMTYRSPSSAAPRPRRCCSTARCLSAPGCRTSPTSPTSRTRWCCPTSSAARRRAREHHRARPAAGAHPDRRPRHAGAHQRAGRHVPRPQTTAPTGTCTATWR